MKLPKEGERRRRIRQQRHQRSRNSDHINDLLRLCLEKITELQADLNKEVIHDPEVAGYTACAIETIKFLTDHGLSPDDPMFRGITERLFRERE